MGITAKDFLFFAGKPRYYPHTKSAQPVNGKQRYNNSQNFLGHKKPPANVYNILCRRFFVCVLNAPTHRRKKDPLRLSDYLKNFVKIFAIVVAQGLCTALFDVSAADTDGREAGKLYGNDAGTAVLDTDNVVSVLKGNSQSDSRHLGIKPGVGLGRKLAESAHRALAKGITGGNGAS